jgi:hypothetical protein
MIALAVALVIMISAVAIVSLQGPATLSLADQGGENQQGDDQTACPDDTGDDQGPAENNECTDPVDQTDLAPCETTITAEKTAVGFWEMVTSYSWSVVKELNENDQVTAASSNGYNIQIEQGETACVSYIIVADRSDACTDEVFGVRGTITVTNTGCFDTADLMICDTIQIAECGGEFSDYATFQVDTSCHPVLAAGECYTYTYEYEFEPCGDALYRNVADVKISNFADDCGEASGVRACAEFDLPCEPECTVVDECACLVDEFNVPCGFEVEALTDTGPWELDDECTHFEFCVNLEVTNVCAPRDSAFVLNNEATLTACDTGTVVSDCVSLCIYSGACETTLDVSKTADVSWSEEIELGLNFPDTATVEDVQSDMVQFAEDASPIVVEQYVISDKGYFIVCGTITVTNTGDAATQGLFITDTVQMWDGSCWIDLVSIDVDTSCMPTLCPGQCYTYNYQVSFCLDNVAMIDFCENELQNVAFAGICNYDDDADVDGAYYYLPLEVPFLPEKVTMETSATYSYESCAPIEVTCEESTMTFSTELSYYQLVEITFCGEEVKLNVVCDISARSSVTYNSNCDSECADVVTAIHYEGCSSVTGEGAVAEVSFQSHDCDDDCMEICIHCQPVDVNIHALLCAANAVSVCYDETGFVINDQQMMFYGAYACFEMPEDGQEPA